MINIKEKLRNGESILGTMINAFDNLDVVRIFKEAGFDLIVIDNEHGYIDYSKTSDMLNLARALELGGLVRIPELKREVVHKYMEMGADGILMPNCTSKKQAEKLIEYAKYSPQGNRGVSLFRSHSGYKEIPSGLDYMKEANKKSLMIVQIESKKGVENINEILEVDGIDAAFIGPNDLSQGYDIFGDKENPILLKAIDKVINSAKQHNKFSGIFTNGDPKEMRRWIRKGMQLNLWSSDTNMLMNYAKRGVSLIKK